MTVLVQLRKRRSTVPTMTDDDRHRGSIAPAFFFAFCVCTTPFLPTPIHPHHHQLLLLYTFHPSNPFYPSNGISNGSRSLTSTFTTCSPGHMTSPSCRVCCRLGAASLRCVFGGGRHRHVSRFVRMDGHKTNRTTVHTQLLIHITHVHTYIRTPPPPRRPLS